MGLAGTLVAIVLAGIPAVDGAVDMDGAPSRIASMGGGCWLTLVLRLCDHALKPSSAGVARGGVETSGGVDEPIIMAVGGADMPRYECCEDESFGRGDGCRPEDELDPGLRSSEMACAIRSRLPKAGISSSLSRLASSSSKRSPVISCSARSASS